MQEGERTEGRRWDGKKEKRKLSTYRSVYKFILLDVLHACACACMWNDAYLFYASAAALHRQPTTQEGCSSPPYTAVVLLQYIKKGGNEERDRRLQVVKLLTALSYCVGSSFTFLCCRISFRIAFNVKRCVSAQKP